MIITKNNNKIGFLIFELRGDDSGTGKVSVDGKGFLEERNWRIIARDSHWYG